MGHFSFIGGRRCSCRKSLIPSVYLITSNVDINYNVHRNHISASKSLNKEQATSVHYTATKTLPSVSSDATTSAPVRRSYSQPELELIPAYAARKKWWSVNDVSKAVITFPTMLSFRIANRRGRFTAFTCTSQGFLKRKLRFRVCRPKKPVSCYCSCNSKYFCISYGKQYFIFMFDVYFHWSWHR